MPNEFIIKNGFRSQGNSQITGSLSTTGSISINGGLTFTGGSNTATISTNASNYQSSRIGQIGGYDFYYGAFNSGGVIIGYNPNQGVNGVTTQGGQPFYLGQFWSGANAFLSIYSGNAQTMYLSNSQLVGIGTSTPTARLQVKGTGTTSATTALLVQNSNTSASLVVNDNGAVAIGQSTPFSFAGNNSLTVNGIVYTSTAGGTSAPALYIGDSGAGAGRGFYGVNQGIGVSTNNATSMYFRGSPNLGSSNYPRIGINVDPTSVLDIRSDYTSSNLLNVSSSIGTVMFISGSGNVGIGTSSPLVSLDIRTSANSSITPLVTVPNTATTLLVGNTETNGVLALGQNNAGQAWLQGRSRLGDGSSQPILLNPLGGNILIGTTTDAGYKLDVNGDARVQSTLNIQRTPADFLVKFINQSNTTTIGAISHDVAGGIAVMGGSTFYANSITVGINDIISFSTAGTGEKMRISSTGNVGIGITTPTSRLSVSGSAGTGSAIYAYKSGSTVLDIQGSQGQLFSVVDALSGSLMSVNDVSGLPILEVFSDDRVVMGTYGAPALIVTGSNTVISGSLRGRVVTLSTASATASMDCSLSNFFDLTLSGSMYLNVLNIQPGETINLRITQPATSGSLNYTSSIKFPNGLPYSASATSSVVDLISFISFDSSTLYATSLKNLV